MLPSNDLSHEKFTSERTTYINMFYNTQSLPKKRYHNVMVQFKTREIPVNVHNGINGLIAQFFGHFNCTDTLFEVLSLKPTNQYIYFVHFLPLNFSFIIHPFYSFFRIFVF